MIVSQLYNEYSDLSYCLLPIPLDAEKSNWRGEGLWNRKKGLTEELVEQHIAGQCVIVAECPNALAWDIDTPVDEMDMLETLERAHRDGFNILASPSTSGTGWHLYLFLANDVRKVLAGAKECALKIAAKYFDFEVCTVYPNHKLLTMPFGSGKFMIDYTGSAIYDISKRPYIKNIAAKLHVDLEVASTKSKASKKVKLGFKKLKIQKRTVKADGKMQEALDALAASTSLEDSIAIYSQYYIEGMRHNITLYLSSLLYRWGLTEQQALDVVGTIAQQKDDKEVEDRLRCVKDTYEKIYYGVKVCGPANRNAPRTAFEATFWGDPLRTIPLEERFLEKATRILGAINEVADSEGWSFVSKRSLAEKTGMSATVIKDFIQEAIKMGLIFRKGNTHDVRYSINFEAVGEAKEILLTIIAKGHIIYNKITKKNERRTSFMGAALFEAFRTAIQGLKTLYGLVVLENSPEERVRLRDYRYRHAVDRRNYRNLLAKRQGVAV